MNYTDIAGFNGKYKVSDNGDIISFLKERPKILKGVKDKAGYLKCIMCQRVLFL